LQEIHKNQAEYSRKNDQAILAEIGQDQLERFHFPTIKQFAIKSIRMVSGERSRLRHCGEYFLKLTSNGNLIRVNRLICDVSGRKHD
jgi:hypothetical protein